MADRSFIDTNVLVYAYDTDEPAKRARALERLGALEPSVMVISAQVLGEFFWAVTRRLRRPLGQEDARAAVSALGLLETVAIDGGLVARAIARVATSQLGYWDALIVESALAAGCTTLLTEDLSDGTWYGSLEVVDPFR